MQSFQSSKGTSLIVHLQLVESYTHENECGQEIPFPLLF